MKVLLTLLLFSNIVCSQNMYLDSIIYRECKKQAYIGMAIIPITYFGKYIGKTRQQSNVIICAGITLNIANIAYFGIKKRKIRNRLKLKR